MLDASTTGADILKFIPGVQFDLQQNISLEGSRNILILVDGKERDRGFVNQIKADQIEKVETMSVSPSKYDANVTGTINIVLKKQANQGINGQINWEIPTSRSLVFIHPSYNLNVSLKKINFYTSFSSEQIHANQLESVHRSYTGENGTLEVQSDQYVRQDYWSHRFNFGFDYNINTKNQVDVYAFYNPFSQEYNGQAKALASGSKIENWQATRSNTDKNNATFYSLYYKHLPNDKGGEFSMEVNNYYLKSESIKEYLVRGEGNASGKISNISRPTQNAIVAKFDGSFPIGKNLVLALGAKTKIQTMLDDNVKDFKYSESVTGVYGTLEYKRNNYDLNVGLRFENSLSELKNEHRNPRNLLFPYTTLNYKMSPEQNIRVAFSRSIERPKIYQLDPFKSIDDPFSVHGGNPFLIPEIRTATFADYSRRFKSDYFSSRLFYTRSESVITNVAFLNDTSAFESSIYNLGTIQQYGVQLSGTFRLGKIISFIPYMRLYGQNCKGNTKAREFPIKDSHQLVFESNLTALFSFKQDINLMVIHQYSGRRNNIQGSSFADAMYIIKLEKTFKKKLKIGISNALPFTKDFIYQGSEINSVNFHSRYSGVIVVPDFSCWFNIGYRFSAGKQHDKNERNREDIEQVPQKGI